jgi:hypothetical protein
MKRIKTLWLVPTILLFSIGLFGQETKPSAFSYSLSYITPYLISSDFLECEFAPIYMNVEANIHYKPFDRISFSSGLGYFTETETYGYINWGAPPDAPDYNHTATESNFRIPIQFNYHWWKSPDYPDWYFKAVYTNAILFSMSRSFENDELIRKRKSDNYYNPSVGLGIGGIFLKNKPVGLIVEGTIEKTLRWETFSKSTFYSLKIGIVL